MAASRVEALHGQGWRGGQYAQTFVIAAVFAVVAGWFVRAGRPDSPRRSFGFGMILAGITGIVMIAGALALLVYVLSHAEFVF